MPIGDIFLIIFMVVAYALIFLGLVRWGTQIAYRTIQNEKAKGKEQEQDKESK